MFNTSKFNSITKNLSKMVEKLQTLEDVNKVKASTIDAKIQKLEGKKQDLDQEANKASAVAKKLEALLSD